MTDIMIRQHSASWTTTFPQGEEEPSGRWRRQLTYQLATPGGGGRRTRLWAKYQARMNVEPGEPQGGYGWVRAQVRKCNPLSLHDIAAFV